MEKLKQDIIMEMKKEMNKIKLEIIEGKATGLRVKRFQPPNGAQKEANPSFLFPPIQRLRPS